MSYPVIIEFAPTDRLVDLKVAFLESDLEDLYGQVTLDVNHNTLGKPTSVKIQFLNQSDQVHWLLSQPSTHTLNQYSTARICC